MKRKLTVAAFATTLAVAPVALAQTAWSDPDNQGTAISRDAPDRNPGLYVDDRGAAGTYSGTPSSESWETEGRGPDSMDPAAGYADQGTAVSRDAPDQSPGLYVDDRGAAGTYSGNPAAESWDTEGRGRDALDPQAGYADEGTAVSGDSPDQSPGLFVDDSGVAGTYSGTPSSESWDTENRANVAPGISGGSGAVRDYGNNARAGATGNARDTNVTGSARPMAGDGRVLVDFDQIPNYDQRQGPGQTRLELMQTTLLNNFSSFGFDGVRDFRKQGMRYVADVSRGGQWMTVELDPDTGTIRTMR